MSCRGPLGLEFHFQPNDGAERMLTKVQFVREAIQDGDMLTLYPEKDRKDDNPGRSVIVIRWEVDASDSDRKKMVEKLKRGNKFPKSATADAPPPSSTIFRPSTQPQTASGQAKEPRRSSGSAWTCPGAEYMDMPSQRRTHDSSLRPGASHALSARVDSQPLTYVSQPPVQPPSGSFSSQPPLQPSPAPPRRSFGQPPESRSPPTSATPKKRPAEGSPLGGSPEKRSPPSCSALPGVVVTSRKSFATDKSSFRGGQMQRVQRPQSGLVSSSFVRSSGVAPQQSGRYNQFRFGETFGLKNLGNTCYLNAVMQSICSLREFTTALHGMAKELPACRDGPLYAASVEILQRMASASPEQGPLSPERIRKQVAEAAPMFQGSGQQDAHEFCLEYMNQLHDELLFAHKASEIQEASLATQLFFDSALRKRLICAECSRGRDVSELFRDFSVDFIGDGKADFCALTEMVQAYFADERLEAKCEHCGCQHARMQKHLLEPPRVLMLHLKRFVPNFQRRRFDKCQADVLIPDELDLKDCLQHFGEPPALEAGSDATALDVAPLTEDGRLPARPQAPEELPEVDVHGFQLLPAEKPASVPSSALVPSSPAKQAPSDWRYSLRSVIAHSGDSPHHGHYVCYSKQTGGRWRLYNDSVVETKEAHWHPSCQGKKAYILFYVLNR